MKEIIERNLGTIQNTKELNNKMIRVDENNNEEILCATKEMISLLNDKNNTYKYISTRQKKF